MVRNMLADKAGDEVVTVVVAGAHLQLQRVPCIPARVAE